MPLGQRFHIIASDDMHSASQRERMQAGPEQIVILGILVVALIAFAALVS